MSKAILLGMLDDIRMWLALRLLDSELRGCISQEDGEKYGDTTCIEDTDKRFRYKYNFMKKVQILGWKILPAFLPVFFHKFFFSKNPDFGDIVINDKTKAIFGSAEKQKFLQHPTKLQITHPSPLESLSPTEKHVLDMDEIAISYDEGNRFISWSGLISFLYKNHWQFVLFLWTIVLYVTGKTLGLWSLIYTSVIH